MEEHTVHDPSLVALSLAIAAIDALDEPAQRWVVAGWVALRYGVTERATALAAGPAFAAAEAKRHALNTAAALWDTPLP